MPPIYTAPTAAALPRTPYLTNAEFAADPGDVDVGDLMPGGSAQQQQDILAQKIWEASAAMDSYVHYTLGATLDTQTARAMVRADDTLGTGAVRLIARGIPIQSIESLSMGISPSTLSAIDVASAGNIWVEDNVILVPATAYDMGTRLFVLYAFVNGYPNTLLAQTAAQGSTSIVVTSSLGIYAGMQLTIYDPGVTEPITVASTYVGGSTASTTIPLTAGLLNAHTISTNNPAISVSALRSDMKMAAKLWTRGLIKTRGGGALVMDAIGTEPGKTEAGEAGGIEDISMAEAMLSRYVLPLYG